MYNNKKILALIPARGGSKGLPGKNVKSLFGKPLIAWSIEAAKKSRYIDEVIVSSDDKKIIDIAFNFGAKAPFVRPDYLANDKASGIDVVLHVIDWLTEKNKKYELLILLQPTSPLRNFEDIDNSIEYFFYKNAKSVVSVSECEHNPLLASTLPEDKSLIEFQQRQYKNKNRQELPDYYRFNGAIYLAYCDYIKKNHGFLGPDSYAFIMPRERSVDIDHHIDFKLAELLIKERS